MQRAQVMHYVWTGEVLPDRGTKNTSRPSGPADGNSGALPLCARVSPVAERRRNHKDLWHGSAPRATTGLHQSGTKRTLKQSAGEPGERRAEEREGKIAKNRSRAEEGCSPGGPRAAPHRRPPAGTAAARRSAARRTAARAARPACERSGARPQRHRATTARPPAAPPRAAPLPRGPRGASEQQAEQQRQRPQPRQQQRARPRAQRRSRHASAPSAWQPRRFRPIGAARRALRASHWLKEGAARGLPAPSGCRAPCGCGRCRVRVRCRWSSARGAP